jgi:hypothetical protein
MRVVSSSVPGDRHVGELLLAAMLEQIPEKEFHFCAITSNPGGAQDIAEQLRIDYVEPPLELIHRANATLVSRSIDCGRRLWAYERFARRTAAKLSDFLSSEDHEPVWIIADSTAVIDCVYYAFRRRAFPFRLQIWDDVRHLASLKHLDPVSANRVFQRFRYLLTRAVDVAVIGEQMAAEYCSLGAKNCRIIRHGLDIDVTVPNLRSPSESFRIGFCGSAYASDAWASLLKALNRMNWTVASRPVELWVVGSEANFSSGHPINAHFFGRRSMEETTRLMADCDLVYMPQSFQKSHDALTRWSFPTKLSTYVATGRPVFFHTPTWGSLSSFAAQHGFRFLCNTLDPANVVQTLRSIEVSPKTLSVESQNSCRVANTVLSHAEFRQQTRMFVGLAD